MTLTPEQRYIFDETVANLFSSPKYRNSYLFYGHMLGQCRIEFDDKLPAPAGVNFQLDHYTLYINPIGTDVEPNKDGNYPKDDQGNEIKHNPGFNEFPLEHRLGIVKHEMLHILNGHVHRRQDRDHQAFNIATDCAINQLIERNHIPNFCIFPDNFPSGPVPENKTAEQYYEYIESQDGDPQNNNGNTQGQGSSKTLDDHSKWNESKGDTELQDDITKNMIEKSISNTQKSQGTVPSGISDWLSLHSHKKELDWRKVLRGIVGNKRVGSRKTIMRQDRRLPNFEWIKGRTKDRVFDLLVISDVSGSVSDDALLSLWGEVRYICDITQSAVKLIQVDTRPYKPEDLTKTTKLIERKACGGTILYPALKMAKDSKLLYDALVVTTDGYLNADDVIKFKILNKRVIWLIESNGQIMPEMSEGRMQVFKLKA